MKRFTVDVTLTLEVEALDKSVARAKARELMEFVQEVTPEIEGCRPYYHEPQEVEA